MEKSEWVGIILIAMLAFSILGSAILGIVRELKYPRNCSYYADTEIAYIPAKCYQYFQIK